MVMGRPKKDDAKVKKNVSLDIKVFKAGKATGNLSRWLNDLALAYLAREKSDFPPRRGKAK